MRVHSRRAYRRVLFALALAALSLGCIRTTPRVIKVGLVAPFEGRYREIGVDVIPAARLAIREWAARSGASHVAVELVAYDDAGDPEQAVEQARKLAADADVRAVVGHWRDDTTRAAAAVYADAGLPVVSFRYTIAASDGVMNLAPSSGDLVAAAQSWEPATGALPVLAGLDAEDVLIEAQNLVEATQPEPGIGPPIWGLSQFYALAEGRAEGAYFVSGMALPEDMAGDYWTPGSVRRFVEGYREGSLDAPPGIFAAASYEATWLAITTALAAEGIDPGPTPVSGFRFDDNGQRLDAPIYLYQWRDGRRVLVAVLP